MHDPHIWGWEIPVYLFLGGLSAGLMIIAALVPKKESMAVRLLPFAAAAVENPETRNKGARKSEPQRARAPRVPRRTPV